MVELTTATSNSSELLLAQLACAKMVGLLKGVVSIGLPAIVTGVPDPRPFLQDQFRVVTSFAIVLHTVSWPVGNVHEILRLREKSGKLLSVLEDFQRQLLATLNSSEPILTNLRLAQQTASALFDSIGEYANLIQLDCAVIANAKATLMPIFDAMEDFENAHSSSAR